MAKLAYLAHSWVPPKGPIDPKTFLQLKSMESNDFSQFITQMKADEWKKFKKIHANKFKIIKYASAILMFTLILFYFLENIVSSDSPLTILGIWICIISFFTAFVNGLSLIASSISMSQAINRKNFYLNSIWKIAQACEDYDSYIIQHKT